MARKNYKICDKCRKPYLRSNKVRLWVATNFGHRYGWAKEEQKICCRCMKADDALTHLKEINPRWRPLKAVEKIIALNAEPPTKKEEQG